MEVLLHRSSEEGFEGGGPVRAVGGKGNWGNTRWYKGAVGAGDKVAMSRTLEVLRRRLGGGCEGVEEAVGLGVEGVKRRVVGADAVVDEVKGGCWVRDVVGGVVVGERWYAAV